MKIEINPVVKEVMEKIDNSGYSVYLVGGAVRDEILNRDNDDYDLCTDMPLELLKNIYSNFNIMKENDHRNTGIMHLNGLEIEVSSFHGNSIEEDLFKRDFTINAMAALKDGELIDPYNGKEDINNKIIRLTDDSGAAIDIDPLRILRAIRFSAILDFKIDDNTKQIVESKKKLLSGVAKERIYSELVKILLSDNPVDSIRDNKEVFFEIIPELKSTDGFNQNNPHHIYDVFEHTLKVIENTPKDIYLRFAALFHDLGKPSTYSVDDKGVGHFIGHQLVSDGIFRDFAKEYRIDSKTVDIVSKLIKQHDKQFSIKPTKITKFMQEFGTDQLERLFMIRKADIKGQNPDYEYYRLLELEKTKKIYEDHLKEKPCLSIKDLQINGRKLIEMGYEGDQIGFILKDILTQVTEARIDNDESSIEDYVNKTY